MSRLRPFPWSPWIAAVGVGTLVLVALTGLFVPVSGTTASSPASPQASHALPTPTADPIFGPTQTPTATPTPTPTPFPTHTPHHMNHTATHQMNHTGNHTNMTHTADGGFGYETPTPTPTPTTTTATAPTPGPSAATTPTPSGDPTTGRESGQDDRDATQSESEAPSDPVSALWNGFQASLSVLIDALSNILNKLLPGTIF